MRHIAFVFCALLLSASGLFAQLKPEACDQRPADRDAIRAHIESIFQAFVDHDGAKLRATHAAEWRGFLEGSQTAIRGVDAYMKVVDGAARPSPDGMKEFKITEFDCVLYGNTAIVPFVADITSTYRDKPYEGTLRIVDFYVKLDGAWIQAGSDTQAHPKSIMAFGSQYVQLSPPMKQQLLEAREHVWKAYFSNERSYLAEALPPELIAIEPGSGDWSTRASVLRGAEKFAQSGTKLSKVEFPRTEIQAYGNVAQLYSTYVLDFDGPQGRRHETGRATETFVYRNGKWLNPGWHMDAEKQAASDSAAK